MAVDMKLKIDSGPKFNLRTTSGLSERLDLGNAIPVPVRDYNTLDNKPQINGIELRGNKTTRQLRIQETDPLSNLEIEQIIESVFN